MALPKLDTPIHKGKIASTGKEVSYRPFKVKEEKILMLASEGGEYADMVNACAQIVGNCCEDVDAFTLPMFDLQDLFLQIRCQSHGAEADFRLHCGNSECKDVTNYTMDLNEFKLTGMENLPSDFIQIPGEEIGIKLRYPGANVGTLIENMDDTELVAKCIEYVVDGEERFSIEDEPAENIVDFVEDLPLDAFNEIREFFREMPQLEHRVEYTCAKCGNENNISINGYEHFFG